MSQYAPRIITMKIDPDKIRDVTGSGGKAIRSNIGKKQALKLTSKMMVQHLSFL